jgi:hypothetical protein
LYIPALVVTSAQDANSRTFNKPVKFFGSGGCTTEVGWGDKNKKVSYRGGVDGLTSFGFGPHSRQGNDKNLRHHHSLY